MKLAKKTSENEIKEIKSTITQSTCCKTPEIQEEYVDGIINSAVKQLISARTSEDL